MKKQMMLFTVLTLSFALLSVPGFAQGKGVGVGAGQAKVDVGTKTQVDAPGVKAGTSTDVKTKASTDVKTGSDKDKDKDRDVKTGADKAGSNANFITKIEANPKLSAKLQALLPTGETLAQAAAGFKSEGQFIAALHASHNLNIPFDKLKADMTGSNKMSLGAAIKAERPDMKTEEAQDQAQKAEKEAKENEKTDKNTDKTDKTAKKDKDDKK
jgi:hypothetical protein